VRIFARVHRGLTRGEVGENKSIAEPSNTTDTVLVDKNVCLGQRCIWMVRYENVKRAYHPEASMDDFKVVHAAQVSGYSSQLSLSKVRVQGMENE